MSVKVKLFAYFRELFGAKEKEIPLAEGATVKDMLDVLCDTPLLRSEIFDGEALKPHVVIMKNGTSIHSSQGLVTPLSDGDILSVFPLMGGG